jgi:hypothetical protein
MQAELPDAHVLRASRLLYETVNTTNRSPLTRGAPQYALIGSELVVRKLIIVVLCFSLGVWAGAALRRARERTPDSPVESLNITNTKADTRPATVAATKRDSFRSQKPSVERRLRDLLFVDRVKHIAGVLAKWSKEDLAKAAEVALRSRVHGDERAYELTECLKQVVVCWARLDAAAAQHWVSSYPYLKDRRTMQGRLLGLLAETNPQAAFAEIDRIAKGTKAQQLQADCFLVWVQEDPASAMAWFLDHPELYWNDRLAAYSTVAWRNDWRAELAFIQALDAGPAKWALERQLWNSERKRTPEMALAHLSSVQAGGPLEANLFDILRVERGSAAGNDYRAKWWSMSDMDLPPSYRIQLARHGLEALTDASGSLLIEPILQKLSTPLSQVQEDAILDQLASHLSGLRIAGKDAAFLKMIPSEEVRNLVVERAVRFLTLSPTGVEIDGEAHLIELQKDPVLQNRMRFHYGAELADENSDKVLPTLERLPPSVERDWSVAGVVAYEAGRDPKEATNRLRLFHTSEAHTAAVKTIAKHWLKRNHGEASAWLNVQRLTSADMADIEEAMKYGSPRGAFQPNGQWTSRP